MRQHAGCWTFECSKLRKRSRHDEIMRLYQLVIDKIDQLLIRDQLHRLRYNDEPTPKRNTGWEFYSYDSGAR